jgi:membrane-bound metal-dependent hydrolase YbcI (DUF457 family)
MFVLFHLLAGLIVGYLLADRLRTRAVVLPCMLGALLPDLVDKPLGIFLLGAHFGTGRIYCHTLAFLLLLLALGAVVCARYRKPALLAVGVGVATHQLLDFMWTQPRAWFYPLFGAFRPINTEGWFLRELLLELGDPVEWVSAAALVVLLLPVLAPARTDTFVARHAGAVRAAALGAVPVLGAAGLYLLASGGLRRFTLLTGWRDPWFNLAGGAVLLLAAYAAWRLAARLGPGAGSNGLK